MITKKVTCQESCQMVFFLAAGLMDIIFIMLSFVWQVGAKIE
jgi:hypothetical protein